MVQKTDHGLYQSSRIRQLSGVIHGFTSKANGSMLDEENRKTLFRSLGVPLDAVVWADQVHGADIRMVTLQDVGKKLEGFDGFIYKKSDTFSQQPLLTVHVGDCAPLLFIDPVAHIIGAAHAGWKGTKDHIARAMIQEFMRNGSTPSDIVVCFGPYIHSCCYAVDEERAMVFEREFAGGRGIVNRAGVSWFIDIGIANKMDIRRAGVPEKNIEWNEKLCTHCNPIEFFSYRRKTEAFGEILGFIGYQA